MKRTPLHLAAAMLLIGVFCYTLDRYGYDRSLEIKPFTIFLCAPGMETVSVKSCGAKGDGLTDDTPAFNRAFNSGASTITIPQGTYILESHMGGLNGDTRVIGAGIDKTVIVQRSRPK